MTGKKRISISSKTKLGNVTIYSINPVLAKAQLIKVSSNQDGNILVVMFNIITSQSIIKYFNNEMDANEFIASVVD
jgi:hypothetical protein